MDQAEAFYTVIIGVGALIGVMEPIIKLNTNIVRLTTLLENVASDNARQDDRLDKHSKVLDDHEKRIGKLEK